MNLNSFYLYDSYIDLYFDNGKSLRIFLNEYTGTIYQRRKIHPILKHLINHKGLYIGTLSDGTHIVIHNHINPGRAILATWLDFAGNEVVTVDNKSCTNSWDEMIIIALEKVIDQEAYHPINYSCQSLVNMSCTNERKNDDTLKVFAGIGLTILAGLAIKEVIDAYSRD